MNDASVPGKRARSISSYSSRSVSTYSTFSSGSLSPPRGDYRHTGQSQTIGNMEISRKRRRRPSSSMSYTSESPSGRYEEMKTQHRSRNCDYRDGDIDNSWPIEKEERRRSRMDGHSDTRAVESLSPTPGVSTRHMSKGLSNEEERSKRRRRSSRSPDDRGRNRNFNGRRGSRRTRTPSESRDRSEVTRLRKSMTPGIPRRPSDGSMTHQVHRPINKDINYSNVTKNRNDKIRDSEIDRRTQNAPPGRGKSLSPFSKRLAITQAMNMGR